MSKLSQLTPYPTTRRHKPRHAQEFEIAFATFEQIRVAFPELAVTVDLYHPHVKYMTINLPVNVGLSEGGPRTGHEIQG